MRYNVFTIKSYKIFYYPNKNSFLGDFLNKLSIFIKLILDTWNLITECNEILKNVQIILWENKSK